MCTNFSFYLFVLFIIIIIIIIITILLTRDGEGDIEYFADMSVFCLPSRL